MVKHHPEVFAAGRLFLLDRNFPGIKLIKDIRAAGAHLLMRIKSDVVLPPLQALPDGSYRSFLADRDCCVPLRVIEYDVTVPGRSGPEEEMFALATTLTDWQAYPAAELAGLYPRRWGASETTIGQDKSEEAAVNIRAGPCDVREPGRDPELVVGGHDRVEGIRVSQVEDRHLRTVRRRRINAPVNSFSAQGSATSACLCGSGSSFQADENRISQVICVSRRVMTQVPGWTSPGAIACTTSAGTSGGAGIHARIALRMLTFVATEIAPTQMMRKCTACSSAISCLASGETPASWSRSFSSYRLPGVVSGCATNARSSSSRCPLVQIAVPGVNSESPGPRTAVSHRACIA